MDVAPDHLLFAVALVAPFVFGYLLAIRWADRFEPEPIGLLVACFVWGAFVATGAGLSAIHWAEQVLTRASDLAGANPFIYALSDVVVAPFLEELFKAFGLYLLFLLSRYWLHEFDGLLDGLVFGAVVGLGYTLTEDSLWVAIASQRGVEAAIELTVLRTVLGGLGHCTFTALTGAGLGVAVESRHRLVRLLAPGVFFVGAVALHSIHNVLAGSGQATAFMKIMVFWVVDALFFAALLLGVRRERSVLRQYLEPEVGQLLGADELEHVLSYFALDLANLRLLFRRDGGWDAYRAATARQAGLISLALLLYRQDRGESSSRLDKKALGLRRKLEARQPSLAPAPRFPIEPGPNSYGS